MKRGERIRERRKALGLSADEVGEMIGRDRATVYKYENEKLKKMDVEVLDLLARALRTTVEYLRGETDDPTDVWSRPLVDVPLVLTPEEETIIHQLRMIPEEDKKIVLHVLDKMVSAFEHSLEEDSNNAGV